MPYSRGEREKCFVYIILCRGGSFYTGVTNNMVDRMRRHNAGTGSKYVRSRRPAHLVWCLTCRSRSDALRLECTIKRMSHKEKEQLVLVGGNIGYPCSKRGKGTGET